MDNNIAEELANKIAVDLSLGYATQVNIEAVLNKLLQYNLTPDEAKDIVFDLVVAMQSYER